MEIKTENIIAAMKTADEAGKNLLRTLFPGIEEEIKKATNRPVQERVKTFEDACDELGICPGELEQMWEDGGIREPDEVAYQKLRLITAALNEGWKPSFTEDEWRYYPWFYFYTQSEIDDMDEDEKQERALKSTGGYQTTYAGLASADSHYAPSYPGAYFGSRLCFKSGRLAEYAATQFAELWMDFLLIRK